MREHIYTINLKRESMKKKIYISPYSSSIRIRAPPPSLPVDYYEQILRSAESRQLEEPALTKTPDATSSVSQERRTETPEQIKIPEATTSVSPEETKIPEAKTSVSPERRTETPEQIKIPEATTSVSPEDTKIPEAKTSVSPERRTTETPEQIKIPEVTTSVSPEETKIPEVIISVSPKRTTTKTQSTHDDTFESFVFNGDRKSAKIFIEKDRSVLTKPISVHSRTALHVVACAGNWDFVEELVKLMPAEELGKPDALGCTALHYAAIGGSTKACKAIVKKSPALTQAMSTRKWTPLLSAAHCSPKDKEVVYYLSSVTTDDGPGRPYTGDLAGMLAYALAAGGFHDIILYLLDKYTGLATAKDDNGLNILDALLSRPQDFQSGTSLGPWTNWIYPFVPVEIDSAPWSTRIDAVHTISRGWPQNLLWNCIELLVPGMKVVRKAKLTHKLANKLVKRVFEEFSKSNDDTESRESFQLNTITGAASSGIVEIVKMCLQVVPDIIWLSTDQQTLLKVTVQYRQEKILNLMHTMTVYNKFTSPRPIDESKNTILHLAAKLSPPAHLRIVPGVALQMQMEVQWFKAVEKLVHPFLKEMPNEDGKTAQDMFNEEHKDLLEKAEKWMKDTSNSGMVVAALIATIMFAAAFTVPGGNNESTGDPVFLRENLFMVFAIADALGLIFSSTSLLVFLSIQTARYTAEDFLESLPKKLIIGLASLFLSIANMMISFGAAFSIVVHDRSEWVAIAIPFLASLPVTIYAILQLPLFVQMYKSTYGSGISFEVLKI